MIVFDKFDHILKERGIKRKDMIEMGIIATPTMAKLKKGDVVTTETIDRICKFLNVQPGDIMNYIPETKEEYQRRRAKVKEKSKIDKERRNSKS